MLVSGLEYILVHYRWLIACFALLPASFLFDIYMHIRAWVIFKCNSAPNQHLAKVKAIQHQVMWYHKHDWFYVVNVCRLFFTCVKYILFCKHT